MLNILININWINILLILISIFLSKRNYIIILLLIELIFLLLILNFILYGIYLDDMLSQFFSFYLITISASETIFGLAFLIIYYKYRNQKITIDYINFIKG
jgi:NADH:ubiquinone oxidoreductase subunit K